MIISISYMDVLRNSMNVCSCSSMRADPTPIAQSWHFSDMLWLHSWRGSHGFPYRYVSWWNFHIYTLLVGGWATPVKNMKVNWDDDIPNINGKIKNGNQTTNQIIFPEYPIIIPLHSHISISKKMWGTTAATLRSQQPTSRPPWVPCWPPLNPSPLCTRFPTCGSAVSG